MLLHTVLTLPPMEGLAKRDRARKLVIRKFSEEFEKMQVGGKVGFSPREL